MSQGIGLLGLPSDILTNIKEEAFVPANEAPKYYVDLTYRNLNNPAKVKKALEDIRFLNPNDNDATDVLNDLYTKAIHINTFRGELGQGAEIQRQKDIFADNANIFKDEHNITNNFRLAENTILQRLFNDTFGGDLYDEQSWRNVYDRFIKSTRINFRDYENGRQGGIQYSTPLTDRSASKIQKFVRRRKLI
jgi:hypothetical protein